MMERTKKEAIRQSTIMCGVLVALLVVGVVIVPSETNFICFIPAIVFIIITWIVSYLEVIKTSKKEEKGSE
ncbi:MAG: hypothetical protein J6M60_04705 [Clostridia bacterium]|nr:hypothetical protein [Clostridia bacterium]